MTRHTSQALVKTKTPGVYRRGQAVRLAVAPVRALLATAVKDGLLRANPATGFRNTWPASPGSTCTPALLIIKQYYVVFMVYGR